MNFILYKQKQMLPQVTENLSWPILYCVANTLLMKNKLANTFGFFLPIEKRRGNRKGKRGWDGKGGGDSQKSRKTIWFEQKSFGSTILWSHPCGTCRRLNSCFMLPEGTVTKLESVKGGFCIAEGRVRGRLLARSSESTYSSSLEPNLQEKGGNPGSAKLSSRSSVSCWKPICSSINNRIPIKGIGIARPTKIQIIHPRNQLRRQKE